ncbi:chemotaxis protein [Alkalilimnicola ehrlichii MLHE-1]|uniref:Response regulator receiver modulated CheW protein n=1 Tax=Alkalilimnicola ehrlichii (strain ATCC BAA-1101 / DSM 17681 / MLHE-1) TaxID=187272 RepID=Q0AA92_ALKEH|nr:chemotaxis protein [Alkalilimnicola ehrlichii]ABI56245.1 response regulator receiver modulated CheW protein [Alkalilimnicola ehrlichii MLHE-1]
MSQILHAVDQRTQLAGRNRMELLLFHFGGAQRYGINVFKVREVIPAPRLSRVPQSHPVARGIAHIRGQTIPVLDLSMAVGGPPLDVGDGGYVVVTEYNRTVQGFLVAGVDRIVNLQWEDVLPPPSQGSGETYLTAIARIEGKMVQIIDVEKVLAELNAAGGLDPRQVEGGADEALQGAEGWHVLVADDSVIARRQVVHTVEDLGLACTAVRDGLEALEQLKAWTGETPSPLDRLLMVISDVEMPRMDGYTLTSRIRTDEALQGLHVLLHSSLSGVFNERMVQQVGADDFLSKFRSNELAARVENRLAAVTQR